MLTIRAYFPAALSTNGASPPPPPPPPPPPGTVRPLDFDIDTLPLHPLEEIPPYHPSYYGFPYPLPPRVDRLPPERNRIQFPYWGLTRYAVGHVAVSTEEWYNLKTTSSWDGSVQVTYDDGAGGTDTLYMRVISAAPVSDPRTPPAGTPGGTTDPIEWRLTLVDQRYEWNDRVFVGSGGAYATWGDMISALVSQACNQTITPTTINALLAAPLNANSPGVAWTKDRMNRLSVCCLVDAACAAVGLRAAVSATGTVTIQNASAATTALNSYSTTIQGEVSYGGKVATTEVPTLIRLVQYDNTGPIWDETISYPPSLLPSRGELLVMLPYKSGGGLYEFSLAVGAWQTPDIWDATFAGFIPLASCSMCGTFVLDHDAGVSRIVADPNRYPWPLATSTLATSGGGGGGTTITTLNTDGSSLLATTDTVAADNATGVSFDSSYGGPNATRLFCYPVSVINWGVLNTDTVNPQEWIGNKGARDTSVAASFPNGVGYRLYSQTIDAGAAATRVGGKAALVTTGEVNGVGGDLTRVQGAIHLTNWGGTGTPGLGRHTVVFGGKTIGGMVFTTTTGGLEPGGLDENAYPFSTGSTSGTYYLNGGWLVKGVTQTVFTAITGTTPGPATGVTYYSSSFSVPAVTIGAARYLNNGGATGRWADTTPMPVACSDGHFVIDTSGQNGRFGVRRSSDLKMGADGTVDVMVSTTQKYRLTFYGGLLHWTEQIGTSPPPPPPGTGQLVVSVVDETGAPLVGRTVTTGYGVGVTDPFGQVVVNPAAPGSGTSTVTLLGGESCKSSASWEGGSALSSFNSVNYTVLASKNTDVVHVISRAAVKMSAITGDLTVLVGDVYVTADISVRTPDRTASAILPGTANNYGLPANFKGRTVYLNATGPVTITGFDATGVADGTTVRVVLRSTSSTITVNHNDAGSSAANRVLITGGAAATYGADDGFEMEYDAADSRWRIWR